MTMAIPVAEGVDRVVKTVELVRREMRRNGDARKPVIITELSWPAALGQVRANRLLGLETTPGGQAARLRAAYARLARERGTLGVDRSTGSTGHRSTTPTRRPPTWRSGSRGSPSSGTARSRPSRSCARTPASRRATRAVPRARPPRAAGSAQAARRVTASSASAARTTAGKRCCGVVGHAHGELRPARLVERPGDLVLAARLARAASRSIGVTASRPPRKLTTPGAGLAELDARLLQAMRFASGSGSRAEAVLELVAQQPEVGDLARARDPAVHVDLGLLVGDVVGRDVGVDVDVEAHGLGAPRRRRACARRRARPRRASACRARSRAPRRGRTARRRAGCPRRGSRGRAWRS